MRQTHTAMRASAHRSAMLARIEHEQRAARAERANRTAQRLSECMHMGTAKCLRCTARECGKS